MDVIVVISYKMDVIVVISYKMDVIVVISYKMDVIKTLKCFSLLDFILPVVFEHQGDAGENR